MCSRCVRFTREVTGTAELCVVGRGSKEQIDVFPGHGLENELSGNVIDLCPVGALLDKDFLFTQRVWVLSGTPSIDGITASGDNIYLEHNDGKIYRIKPRTNMAVNTWWITDEVRYGWKFIHSPDRLSQPMRKQFGTPLASFQALRHRMADVKMQLELARSMSFFATLKLGETPAQRRRALSQAKVQIGQSARFVSQQCLQLHGGIGMTDEYAASHYFKRLAMLEMQFGDTLHHLGEVASRMQDTAGVFA
jgi:NADH dehydrogenase/NADH:ubiquinone oxidoreductase subunit G